MVTEVLLTCICALMRLATTHEMCETTTNNIHNHYWSSAESVEGELQQEQQQVVGPPGRPGKRGAIGLPGTPGERGLKVFILYFIS